MDKIELFLINCELLYSFDINVTRVTFLFVVSLIFQFILEISVHHI